MTPPRRLLFVCSGNTCRSPMAEVAARERLRSGAGTGATECRSAGTFAARGGRASPQAREVAREEGLDLSEHSSSPLTEELVKWADLVLCMDEVHLRTVEEMGAAGKAALLTDFLPEGHPARGSAVRDPHGGDVAVYRETFALVDEAVKGLAGELAEGPAGEAEGKDG